MLKKLAETQVHTGIPFSLPLSLFRRQTSATDAKEIGFILEVAVLLSNRIGSSGIIPGPGWSWDVNCGGGLFSIRALG